MQRSSHFLRQTVGNTLPNNVCVLAIDVVREKSGLSERAYKLRLFSGTLIRFRFREGKPSCRLVKHFNYPWELWDALESSATSGTLQWIFSHNVKRDAAVLGLWDMILEEKVDLWGDDPTSPQVPKDKGKGKWAGCAILGDPPTIIGFRFAGKRGTFKWLDLKNYGIEQSADLISFLSEHDRADLDNPDPFDVARRTDLLHAIAVERWFLSHASFLHEHGLGSMKETAASQSQYAFRRQYMKHKILCHGNEEILALERAALYGGRCECRFIGVVERSKEIYLPIGGKELFPGRLVIGGSVYQLDVNSHYPAVALGAKIPCLLEHEFHSMRVAGLAELTKRKACVARVGIETDKPIYPVRLKDRVVFPTGRFITTLCGPELETALASGHLRAVERVACYHADTIFDDWVNGMWKLITLADAKGDKSKYRLAKKMIVALFGRFAMRSQQWVNRKDRFATKPFDYWHETNQETGQIEDWRSFAWHVQQRIDLGEHINSCPVITAWINSIGRIRLWDLINMAGPENVLYYDTDSVWCTEPGYKALCSAGQVMVGELGKLKLAGLYDHVRFAGVKRYAVDGRWKIAGVPPESISPDGLSSTFDRTVAINADLAAHNSPQAVEVVHFRRLIGEYKQGKVLPQGEVVPYHYDDGTFYRQDQGKSVQ